MNSVSLYFRYTATLLKAKAQYPMSFVMLCLAAFISAWFDLIGIGALFSRFNQLMGWTLEEIALLYGIIQVSFALGEGLGRGFDQFYTYVKTGDFDILLLRPRNTALQVAVTELKIAHIGTLCQGVVIIVWALYPLNIFLSPYYMLLVLLTVIGGACLFYGLLIIQATMTFWTTETLEMMNILTYGGADLGKYPISIYKKWFRRFFIFVVPIGSITYFPLHTILGKKELFFGTPYWIGWVTPIAGIAFLLVSLALWNIGVRHYRSTGS
jgi:ABC-2 type transport system permease protein